MPSPSELLLASGYCLRTDSAVGLMPMPSGSAALMSAAVNFWITPAVLRKVTMPFFRSTDGTLRLMLVALASRRPS